MDVPEVFVNRPDLPRCDAEKLDGRHGLVRPRSFDTVSDVLSAAWRTVAFGWRFGSALVSAAVASVVGALIGLVVFAILAAFVPAGYGNLVWSGGIVLTAVAFAGFVFLGRFLKPLSQPDVMGSAA